MTLSPEQQQAIEGLLAFVPPAYLRPTTQGNGHKPPEIDLLETWLGISSSDLKTRLKEILADKDRLEGHFLDWIDRNPLDATFEFLAAASYAFYLVEKKHNPKIKTFIDAFYYISTCASVGYADVFAVTQPGRAIASLVMTVGPAITNRALERPGKERGEGNKG